MYVQPLVLSPSHTNLSVGYGHVYIEKYLTLMRNQITRTECTWQFAAVYMQIHNCLCAGGIQTPIVISLHPSLSLKHTHEKAKSTAKDKQPTSRCLMTFETGIQVGISTKEHKTLYRYFGQHTESDVTHDELM